MSNEREYQSHKRDLIDAAKELGIHLPEGQVEEKLRNIQARAPRNTTCR
jgi:hypothetical protein